MVNRCHFSICKLVMSIQCECYCGDFCIRLAAQYTDCSLRTIKSLELILRRLELDLSLHRLYLARYRGKTIHEGTELDQHIRLIIKEKEHKEAAIRCCTLLLERSKRLRRRLKKLEWHE